MPRRRPRCKAGASATPPGLAVDRLDERVDLVADGLAQEECVQEEVSVTVTLLSGASLADPSFYVGAKVGDVCRRLQEIRPIGGESEYRLVVGACALEQFDEIAEQHVGGLTAVAVVSQRTSVIIKNVPYDWTPTQMCLWLNSCGLADMFDLIYVPIDLTKIDLQGGSNLGYFFVNFRCEDDARQSLRRLRDIPLLPSRETWASYADWQGQSVYLARCKQKLSSGEAHQLMGLRLGVAAFHDSGALLPLEDWLGVSDLPSLHDIGIAIAAKPCAVLRGPNWASSSWRDAVFARFGVQ